MFQYIWTGRKREESLQQRKAIKNKEKARKQQEKARNQPTRGQGHKKSTVTNDVFLLLCMCC